MKRQIKICSKCPYYEDFAGVNGQEVSVCKKECGSLRYVLIDNEKNGYAVAFGDDGKMYLGLMTKDFLLKDVLEDCALYTEYCMFEWYKKNETTA